MGQMTRERENWIEEYDGCDCTSGATVKRDLLGYCGTHGSARKRAIDVRPATVRKVNEVFAATRRGAQGGGTR